MSQKALVLPITGMTNANYAATIKRGLHKLQGIQRADVNFVSGRVNLIIDDALPLTATALGVIQYLNRRCFSRKCLGHGHG